jgi:phospholipid transport system substrate-binding protein
MNRTVTGVRRILMIGLAAASVAAAAEDDAAAIVARLHKALIDVAAADTSLSVGERFDALNPVVSGTHDLEAMARYTINGRTWRGWEESQRQAFIDVFARLSVQSYASRFGSVGPDTFELLGTEAVSDNRTLVRALIHRSDADDVSMDYLLQLDGENWRIVSIEADGVSELALMRSDFFAVFEEGGFEGLIEEIESEIAKLGNPDREL